MADIPKEPEYRGDGRSKHTSLVDHLANEIIEMVREEQVDDWKTDEGRRDTWDQINDGYLSDKGDKFIGDLLAKISLILFTYRK